jgi:DNA-binding NtrC family response regulator
VKLHDIIKTALDDAAGDMEAAAKALGMATPALQRKIKKWGLSA